MCFSKSLPNRLEQYLKAEEEIRRLNGKLEEEIDGILGIRSPKRIKDIADRINDIKNNSKTVMKAQK